MTNFEWLMTLSEEEFTNWVYDQWLHHLQYKWSSSRGGLMIWLKEERAEQTEPSSSEIPNSSTISKMEQVDKDINVRSKDERQRTKENCKGCKYNEYPYDSGTCFVRVCINGNKYEPKDEPQTEDADCDKCIWSVCNYNKAFAFEDEPQADCDGCQHYADKHTADACYECKRSYTDGYEPQTERSE